MKLIRRHDVTRSKPGVTRRFQFTTVRRRAAIVIVLNHRARLAYGLVLDVDGNTCARIRVIYMRTRCARSGNGTCRKCQFELFYSFRTANNYYVIII